MAEERRERHVLWFFLGAVKANKIFFIDNYFLAFDLFSVSLIDYDFYISQNLKNIINQEKITGVNLIESNKFCVGLQYG